MRRLRLCALCVSTVSVTALFLGCAGGMRFQEAVDRQGNVVLRSNNYDVRTKEVYLVYQTAKGVQRFFKFPNSTFIANAWFTYKCEISPSRCRGMTAVDGPGDNFLKQGDVVIGQPFQPAFDDWSNPCWGINVERVLLQEVSRGDLPTAPPELVPSVWNREPPPGLDDKQIQGFAMENSIKSAFFVGAQATTVEIAPATGQAYVKEGHLMFFLQLINPYTNTYRAVAYTNESPPSRE